MAQVIFLCCRPKDTFLLWDVFDAYLRCVDCPLPSKNLRSHFQLFICVFFLLILILFALFSLIFPDTQQYINPFKHEKATMIITENSVYHGGFIKKYKLCSSPAAKGLRRIVLDPAELRPR